MNRKEYLRIEQAVWKTNGHRLLYDIELQLFEQELTGIITDHFQSLDILAEIFKGNFPLTQGIITYRGMHLPKTSDFEKVLDKTMVINHQSQIVEQLSLAENIYIMRSNLKEHLLKTSKIIRKTEKLLMKFQLQSLKDKPLELFSDAERFQIELLKAFASGKELVVLDYRKINLFQEEFHQLLQLIKRLSQNGMQFLILENTPFRIIEYVNQIVLLRRRRTSMIWDFAFMPRQRCIQALEQLFSQNTPSPPETPKSTHVQQILEAIDLQGKHFSKLSFKVWEQEIVGIIIRNSQAFHELSKILQGIKQPLSGELRFLNRNFTLKNTEHAVKTGLCFIENHLGNDNLFYNLSVFDNLCIVKGGRIKKVWRNRRYQSSIIQFISQHFGKDISRKKLSELSQEDIYRIMYYKWYLLHPKICICINPFFMTDLNTANLIRKIMGEFVESNISVLILTQSEQNIDQLQIKKVIV